MPSKTEKSETERKRAAVTAGISTARESERMKAKRTADKYRNYQLQMIGAGIVILILLIALIKQRDIFCMFSFISFFIPTAFKYLIWHNKNFICRWMINIGAIVSFSLLLFYAAIKNIPQCLVSLACFLCFICSFGELIILIFDTIESRSAYDAID